MTERGLLKSRYPGVVPRVKWMLQAFGTGAQVVQHSTNIVFSDGDKVYSILRRQSVTVRSCFFLMFCSLCDREFCALQDPWSVGGIPFDAVSPDKSVFHVRFSLAENWTVLCLRLCSLTLPLS